MTTQHTLDNNAPEPVDYKALYLAEQQRRMELEACFHMAIDERPDEKLGFDHWLTNEAPHSYEVPSQNLARHAWLAGLAYADKHPVNPTAPASEPPNGEVVVTWNPEQTRILAVTRQNDEGQVLHVIALAPSAHGDAAPPAAELVEKLNDLLHKAMRQSVPRTPEQIRQFVGGNFSSVQFAKGDVTPHEDDTYSMTTHDLITAFQWLDLPDLELETLAQDGLTVSRVLAVTQESEQQANARRYSTLKAQLGFNLGADEGVGKFQVSQKTEKGEATYLYGSHLDARLDATERSQP